MHNNLGSSHGQFAIAVSFAMVILLAGCASSGASSVSPSPTATARQAFVTPAHPNCCDHWLKRVSGNVGYNWVSIQGHQGYSYRGVFDTGGNDYYNSYTNNLTGNANGTWSCSYSYYWKKSAPGWHTQSWCGTGRYA